MFQTCTNILDSFFNNSRNFWISLIYILAYKLEPMKIHNFLHTCVSGVKNFKHMCYGFLCCVCQWSDFIAIIVVFYFVNQSRFYF